MNSVEFAGLSHCTIWTVRESASRWCGSTYYPDADPDFDFYLMRIRIRIFTDADPDPDPSLKKKAQTLEKLLKQYHIPYILAWHQQIDADPDPA